MSRVSLHQSSRRPWTFNQKPSVCAWCVRAGDMFLQPFGATIELPADHEAIDRLGAIAKEATVRATKQRYRCAVPQWQAEQ